MTAFVKHLKNQKTTWQNKIMNYKDKKFAHTEVILTQTNLLMLGEI